MVDTALPFTVASFPASDGYRWQYRRYRPAGEPLAHVVCLHGIQSHAGWYSHSCSRLSAAGFLVDFLDRRGAGMNQDSRGDAPSFRRLLDDLAEFLKAPATHHSALSTHLVAISWGGKLAVALQRRQPGLVDGLALICPGLFPQVQNTLRERVGIACCRLITPTRMFPIPLNDPELFTATPHWQQFIRDDPLALHQATARLLLESRRLDLYIRLFRPDIRVPILLMLAEHDRIIQNQPTRRFVEELASQQKEIIEYRGAQHTLEFEPDPDRFVQDLIGWLEKHSKPNR